MTIDRPIRLAFTLISRKAWAGGYNYQLNLFTALARYCPGAITPVVFAAEQDGADVEAVARIPGVEIVRSAAFSRSSLRTLLPTLFARDLHAIASFRRHKIDAVWENARFFGWMSPFPTVAWIPDLQHRQLPQLFTAGARWRRELGFRLQILGNRTIMLSSESAERDCLSYYPRTQGRTAVVRFASEPAPELLTRNPVDVLKTYDLPSRYFYLPNQFWRHKNHRLVISALAILKQRGVQVTVAVSGGANPNEPGYLDDIVREVTGQQLDGAFRYLGMIPLPDVYALLRACTALINPSRFEGWSTTVEEAKSFSVPMVLSNIDVHREQTRGSALYFSPDDAETLADHLQAIARQAPVIRDVGSDTGERVRQFAENFVTAVDRIVASRR
ncbi:glycosyltransferase family 4 protein [Tardiphaga sp.]|uniref:glycosyltransferase family 4 protein n=1 Tax=Tardiphaga sp. TaxID=1926292 RepID=UPI0037DA2B53